jgi:hypothetical protein
VLSPPFAQRLGAEIHYAMPLKLSREGLDVVPMG